MHRLRAGPGRARHQLPGRASRLHRGHLFRHQGARALPVDGEPDQSRAAPVGRRGEQADRCLHGQDPAARVDQPSADATVELRQGKHARPAQERHAVLPPQRRPAEPERGVRAGLAHRQGAGAARSQQALTGRLHRPGRHRALPEWQIPGLRAVQGWLGLADPARAGCRHRQATLRHGALGEVLRHLLDQGQQGFLLLALPRTAQGREGHQSCRRPPEALLPPPGHAAIRRQADPGAAQASPGLHRRQRQRGWTLPVRVRAGPFHQQQPALLRQARPSRPSGPGRQHQAPVHQAGCLL